MFLGGKAPDCALTTVIYICKECVSVNPECVWVGGIWDTTRFLGVPGNLAVIVHTLGTKTLGQRLSRCGSSVSPLLEIIRGWLPQTFLWDSWFFPSDTLTTKQPWVVDQTESPDLRANDQTDPRTRRHDQDKVSVNPPAVFSLWMSAFL